MKRQHRSISDLSVTSRVEDFILCYWCEDSSKPHKYGLAKDLVSDKTTVYFCRTQGHNHLNHYHHSSFTLQEPHGSERLLCLTRALRCSAFSLFQFIQTDGRVLGLTCRGLNGSGVVYQPISTQLNWGQVSLLHSELTEDQCQVLQCSRHHSLLIV